MQKRPNDKKGAKEFYDPDTFESEIGINYINQGEEFVGYLSNIKPFSISEENNLQTVVSADRSSQVSCLLLYFYCENPDQNGNVLKKCVYIYEPYFYIVVNPEIIEEFQQYISKMFEGKVTSTEIIEKIDLEMINHLSGIKKKFLKLNFKNVSNLVSVRNTLRPIVQKNKTKEKVLSYSELLNPTTKIDMLDMIKDLKEDDIPYHVRVCIDNEIRCGMWYKVSSAEKGCNLTLLKDKLTKCPLTVLAFDIETTKAPLKFPDPRVDSVMLISYMIDGDGFLITNRSIISEEIEDFHYTPKPEFDGHFHIFNEEDEEALLKRFVKHCRERRPNIFVTFNGDYFDIPFIGERLKIYGMSLEASLGIQNTTGTGKTNEGEYMGRFSVHIDCLYWVKRDAFLPQGSHGLKAVTKAKLGYDPIEVDPEKMVESAMKTPRQFCAYSVSDALATYYLYQLMIHDFIYALCTIIPTYPDEVLRKGSGTLCEDLLMTRAFRNNIIIPEKQIGEFEKFFQGHLIDSETYIGGHVECLNVGVYRADIKTGFQIDPSAYDFLISNIENYIKFSLEIENKGSGSIEDLKNYDQVVNDIKERLTSIKKLALEGHKGQISEYPLIYHLDVGAMYPNIILTNKLQPVSMVNEQICAGCIYNREDSHCKKPMKWNWKGEMFPLTRSEYENLKHQYEFELINSVEDKDFEQLNIDDYKKKFIKRIKTYCSKVYKQIHVKKVELKEGIVCQRENPFYVDTIRDFRDRRYEFKFLVKKWKGKNEEAKLAKDVEAIQNTKNMIDLYESLQLAHKIILNSFYGYVMRKGSRWFSMEMAAMVTHLGSNLITEAREFCERIGKPLELDTDGIWCCLPKGFPEVYKLELKSGKKLNYSFPCTMLNRMIYLKYSNVQYNELTSANTWNVRTEMSVFFEVDGPYKAMVLPAAKEEGKMLKKRYAVFGFDGRITELKGFELKRRGELKIIKIFQGEVFEQFLKGTDLKECYDACAEIASRWYSILEAEGEGIEDEELLDYIEESRMMSKSLEEYGSQKSTTITCIKRLAEILGGELLKDKGLCAKFIISKKPIETPVAERSIPTVIFQSPPNIKKKLLRKWLNDYTIDEINMRDVIDWNYYKERLAGNILKLVIIPAAMQKVENPYPNIPYPEWVSRLMMKKNNTQKNLKNFFKEVSNVDRLISVQEDLEKLEIKKKNDAANGEKKNKKEEPVKNNEIGKYLKKRPLIAYEQPREKEVEEEKNETPIHISEDFDGWLKQQKKKWKALQKKKSTRVSTPKKASINFRSNPDKEKNFATHSLNILQVMEHPSNPGVLSLWISFGNYMEKIQIAMKRKIYINSLQQNVPDVFIPVKYILPRSKPVLNLYEFELEEKDFKDKFNNFNDYIISPTIEGVYETKVPLSFQLIKEFGNCFKFTNKRKITNALNKNVFLFSDFEQKSSEFDQLKPEPNKIFFYHSFTGSRHFICLVISHTKEVFVSIVSPVIKGMEMPNIKKLVQNLLNNLKNESEGLEVSLDFDFEVKSVTELDLKLAMRNMNKNVADLFKGSAFIPPTILLAISPYSTKKLNELGFTSILDFPLITIPSNQPENEFPALDWIKFAASKFTYRYIDVCSTYDFRMQLSRYCNIPICNFEVDSMLYSADLIFSRVLSGSKQILWYSPNGFPDLGGGDLTHDFLGQVDTGFQPVTKPGMYLGYVAEIDIGLFCVNTILESEHMRDYNGKFDLQYIDKEKKNFGESRTNEENIKKLEQYKLERDEFVLASNAFTVMKKMVEKWFFDVTQYQNTCADYLLAHFYRWVSSFGSKFFDPVINRMINLLMTKFFSILVKKITDFGFEVVYADSKKVMIFNNKSDYESFQSNVNFLIDSIKKIPLFANISLTENCYWKMFLFKDLYNYAGIQGTEKNEEDNLTDPKIVSKWTLSEFLPPILEKDFISLISDYIFKMYRFFYLKDAEMVSNLKSFYSHQDFGIKQAEDLLEKLKHNPLEQTVKPEEIIDDFKGFLIKDYLSTKLFNIIPNIMMKKRDNYVDDDEDILENPDNLEEDNNNNNEAPLFTREDFVDDYDGYSDYDEYENEKNEDNQNYDEATNYKQMIRNPKNEKKNQVSSLWKYPEKLGSYDLDQRNNLACEYINYVCEILSVDKSIKNDAMLLKKNCLKLIGVEEYSKETYFRDPCRTFVLKDVICEFCSSTKDIDFCRDTDILENNWTCEHCGNAQFDKKMIEYQLIRKVQTIIDYYFNQDLQCKKCTNQKNEFIFKLCPCAGEYKKTFEENFLPSFENMHSINEIISTLRDIASYYNFDILKTLLSDFAI